MYKFFAVTLVALSLVACGSKDETPAPVGCTEGQVEQVNDAGDHVCVTPAVETPAVEADAAFVPAEGIAVTVDPAAAAKAE